MGRRWVIPPTLPHSGHGSCQFAPPRRLPPTLPRTRIGGECSCVAGMRSNKQQHTLSRECSAVKHMMNGHSHVCETNSNYGDLKGEIREITGVGRLVGREPLEMTRTHACTTSEQSCSCRWGNIQTNTDQRHKRSKRDSELLAFSNLCTVADGVRGRHRPCRICDMRGASRQLKRFDAD